MSCNYADGLSPYDDKGILGVPEIFDDIDSIESKCKLLADWIRQSNHVVVHTGAGISTAAGIPDFRGPNGVWTMEKKGLKPDINISFDEAIPTKTHMALKKLIETGHVQFIVSQNIDGLHMRSGILRKHLAELHGNMFIEQCELCEKQFIRTSSTTTVGQKCLNKNCPRIQITGRACRGKLHDTILDWEANLPEKDLTMSQYHSSVADLNICLGTTLQIVPSGNLPISCKKFNGKVVIVNLQPTKHDKKANLIINAYVDNILSKLMNHLNLEIPDYSNKLDPTKNQEPAQLIEWTIQKIYIKHIKDIYDQKCKPKKRKINITKTEDLKKKEIKIDN